MPSRRPWLRRCRVAVLCPFVVAVGQGVDVCPVPEPALLPPVLVLTLVLPDGLGDVVFGECAALELASSPAAVTWIRAYPSAVAFEAGERLLSADLPLRASLAFPTPAAFAAELEGGRLDGLWEGAREVFLAPWIFGIYEHEGHLLALAARAQRWFWALTEYGRGMGPIGEYTEGLGKRVPTGWPATVPGGRGAEVDGAVGGTAGVFKTILRAERTATDWRARLADQLGLDVGPDHNKSVRLWWAYSRRDSAHAHAFRLEPAPVGRDVEGNGTGGRRWPEVAKIVPVADDGSLASGATKTSGELLADQASALLRDPSHEANLDLAVPTEVAAHIAGQLSQLIVHILTRELATEEREAAEVLVAPNLGLSSWAGSRAVRLTHLELVAPAGSVQRVKLGRPFFIVEERVPRAEMRAFLEQCEAEVVATGDQSVAEAVLLGKLPLARPDAKVAQWELAVAAWAEQRVAEVPDLGAALRRLLWSPSARTEAAARSDSESAALGARLRAERRGPDQRTQAEETMIRAGMMG